MTQVLGLLLILIVCPLLGGLPLIAWITYGLTGRRLAQTGTGNISVSAAFYHGGRWAGILAVLSEAFKGIAAVLLARFFFPEDPTWEIVALIALVMGRYWMGRGAGTTNVVWGFVVHDWLSAGLLFLISGIGFTLLRERQLGRLAVLVLLPLIMALRHPDEGPRIGATLTLSLVLAWIYQKIPDDLDLPPDMARSSSRKVFRFFRGDRAIQSLDRQLTVEKVGQKAATLAQLKRWGYPIPAGWVLPPGDDPAPLIDLLHPSAETPLVVRSSAIGEDSETASAAGQYESILNITNQLDLEQAIIRCQSSYDLPGAVRYRQDRSLPDQGMAVLVQAQVQGVFSGVAFSRDPVHRQGEAVIVEGLPGMASRVVSGQVTPEHYRVWIAEGLISASAETEPTGTASIRWILPDSLNLEVEGQGDLPPRLIQQVAYLARHLETQYHGIPQDIEWSYDGQYLWLLQARPITTLLPIWTRKIAAEVIPGFIHPLTWSVNRPLTCGVWGEIFTVVLGDRSRGLNFNETATLHHSAAYFNATLLGQIFQRMGLPPESLEFLTRGAKFSKPPFQSTLRNLPGLWRLAQLELRLAKDFQRDDQERFSPGLQNLQSQSVESLTTAALLERINQILWLLRRVTYYSIMAPLSAALRQALFKVPQTALDNSQTPEVASLRSLQTLAEQSRPLLPQLNQLDPQSSSVFAALAESPDGQTVLHQLEEFLAEYGYLSEVATDIAVPTWKEDPRPVRSLFSQFLLQPGMADRNSSRAGAGARSNSGTPPTWKIRPVQHRLNLKGQVSTVYNKLLAELRWTFVALERQWIEAGLLSESGDIFFLRSNEIERILSQVDPELQRRLPQRIAARRANLDRDRQITPPLLVYGNDPPTLVEETSPFLGSASVGSASAQRLQGIGVSPGQAEGRIKVLRTLQTDLPVDRETILVVPYTDAGWAPLLAQAGGLIAEVGGQLSHGAIVAREYGLPAVLNIHQATQKLRDGQRVRVDGEQGVVEILD